MSIQVRSNDKPVAPPEVKSPAETPSESADASSAPEAKASEQKEAHSESETDAAEEKEDSEVEGEGSEAPRGEADTEAKDGKPGKKGGFQRRIDKLNQRVSAKEQEAEYWKQEALKRATGEKPEAKVETPKATGGKPNPENFNTHAEYVEALTDWKTDQKFIERDQRVEKSKQQIEAEKVVKSYNERKESFSAKHEDYDEVIAELDDVPLSPAVREIILTSDNGPAIPYQFANNRDEWKRINSLSPLAAAREIGKIESRIDAKSSGGQSSEPKKLTSAPKPLEPVGSGKGSAKKSITDPNLSQREYEAIRMAEIKKRRQA